MNGLLDFISTPAGQGLLAAVAGGMAGANRGTPWNNAGRAGLAGLMGYSNAQNMAMKQEETAFQKQYRQMQMEEMQRKSAQQKAQQDWLESNNPGAMQGGPTQENAANIQQVDPRQKMLWDMAQRGIIPMSEYINATKPKDPKFQAFGAGIFDTSAVGPDGMPRRVGKVEQQAPEGMQYDQAGNLVEIPGYVGMRSKIAAAGRNPAQPYFQFLPTAEGYAVGNARSGSIAPASIGGKAVLRAADSPELQGQISQAKEIGKVTGEEVTKAQFDSPRIIDTANTALKLSGELITHPGFKQAVGKSSMLGIQNIPGTDAKDFMNRLDQVRGGAFLEAFNTLKGGGQITEVEGKKATDAIARMNNTTSETEFKQAVADYQEVIRKGMNRAKMKAKPVSPVQQPQQGGAKFLGFE